MKILIAEDDATSCKMLERMLVKWGYEVVITCDGNAAWRELQAEGAPPLAILDWMMPEMDGVEVCRRLRQIKTSTPTYVILLTTRSNKEDIVEGLKFGADDYISKPFDNNELHARIEVGRRVVELQAALADRVKDLQDALDHVKTLQGILPICAYCKKIRDDRNYWQQVESYVSHHSSARFSHSICPECYEKQVKLQLQD